MYWTTVVFLLVALTCVFYGKQIYTEKEGKSSTDGN